MEKEVNNPIEKNRYIDKVVDRGKLRRAAFHERFGLEYNEDSRYFLPDSYYDSLFSKTEASLDQWGSRVDCKLMPYSGYPEIFGVVEIDVDDRRYAIPRDEFGEDKKTGLRWLEVSDLVVSVNKKDKWPTKMPFEMTPQIESALNDIDGQSLVDDTMDLAKYLRLGDKAHVDKRSYYKKKIIDEALEKFGVETPDQLVTILKSIDLRIIRTSDRLEDLDNTETEVDAILEAISIADSYNHKRR